MAKMNIVLRLINLLGQAINPATEDTLAGRFNSITPMALEGAAAGTFLMAEPPSGEALRVNWLFNQALAEVADGELEFAWKFDASETGDGEWRYLNACTGSQPFAHGIRWEGALNERLYIKVEGAGRWIANADVQFFEPA